LAETLPHEKILPALKLRKERLEGNEAMMSKQSRRELLAAVAPRYREASRAERGRILNEFVASTGYHRKYAIHLLTHPLSAPAPRRSGKKHPRRYDFAVQQALITCWRASNGICSKRLVPYLPELVAVLERHEELRLEKATKEKLLALSPATADRLLSAERERSRLHGFSTTRPGTLLREDVPIRLGTEWDDVQVGFVELDLVAHCGESVKGDYLYTLTLTDILTGWTECLAVRNRGQQAVFRAIVRARARFPFPLRGIDSDNGGEFLNNHLVRYCQDEHLVFTRSRPFKKNDQAHVEQKNWSVVRHLVGYDRYESQVAWDALQDLYDVVRHDAQLFPALYAHCSLKSELAARSKRRMMKPRLRILGFWHPSRWKLRSKRFSSKSMPRSIRSPFCARSSNVKLLFGNLLSARVLLQRFSPIKGRVRFTNEATLPPR
jgi:hypothetical protein